MPERCMWCEKPSEFLCDAPIGFLADGCERDKLGNVKQLLTGKRALDGGYWTCDAPMCADHRKMIGHVCGKYHDTIDRCPYHVEHGEGRFKKMIGFEHEMDGWRRKVHAEIRRSQFVRS